MVTASQLAKPWILAFVLNDMTQGTGSLPRLMAAVGAYILTFSAGTVAGLVQTLRLSRMGVMIMTDLKERVFAHVLSLGVAFHDRNPVGKLISRTESDAEMIKELFSRTAIQIASNGILFAGSLATMLIVDIKVATVFLVLVPILTVATLVFIRIMRRLYREGRRLYAEVTATIAEYVQGVPVVQQFNQRERAGEILRKRDREKYAVNLKAWTLDYTFWGVFRFAEALAMAGILWLGSGAILDGVMEVGTVVLFIEYTRQVFVPIVELGEQLNQIQRAVASADRVFDLLDEAPEVADREGARTHAPFDREIRFENLSYSYDGGRTHALTGVDFTVARGERVALVGPSGGGKSTVVSLLCRFLDPTSGRVTVDGTDLRDFTQAAWRERIGLVLQEIYLFPGTVLDNLRVLDDRVSRERVMGATRAVRADRFVRSLPAGYDSDLAERGANLSLGERQLLSFARALAFDPDLLILDEATSSVDPETERRIQDSLHLLLQNRTAVIVAHRLETIRDADRILVFEQGRIVEEGDHETLLRNGGVYRDLYDLQSIGNGGAS